MTNYQCLIDLTGHRFGRYLVTARSPENGVNGQAKWVCKCNCGTEKTVLGRSLRIGATVSCGCYWRERTSESSRKHGLHGTTEYTIWATMRQRCANKNNPGYSRYGGRGIRVCKRWGKFENFYADMGKRPEGKSLDRKNNNGDYKPSNCKWSTRLEQGKNTQKNVYFTDEKIILHLAEWVRRLGLNQTVIKRVLRQVPGPT